MILRYDNNTPSLYYSQLTQIEGVEYIHQFLWSDRETCWYLDLFDQDENRLASGIKLALGVDLLRRFKFNPTMPQGLLYLVDTSNRDLDIQTPGELGDRVPLYYITADDPILTGAAA